jgi:hypothetical protein
MQKQPGKPVRFPYERRISLFALLVALPGIVVSAVVIWLQSWPGSSKLLLCFVVLFVWAFLAMTLHEQTIRPLQTLANVVGALREEDYSFRARGAVPEDALGELSLEVNALAPTCSQTAVCGPSRRLLCSAESSTKSMFRCLLLIRIGA